MAVANAEVLPDPLGKCGLSGHGDTPTWVGKAVPGLTYVGDIAAQGFADRPQLAFNVTRQFLVGHALGMFFFFCFGQCDRGRDRRT